MSELLGLSPGVTLLAIAACVCAGAIRGFAGFGLSALVMAILAPLVPPVQLIPVFWFLEMAASLVLMKGGWQDADRHTALLLIAGAGVGLPLGLCMSLMMNPVTSKTAALTVLIVLATLHLAHVRMSFLAARQGTLASGVSAGLVTGIAGAGGMLMALYTLARGLPPRQMRGTLNIVLLGGGVVGLIIHLIVGTMTVEAATRGAVLIWPVLIGVFLGKALFVPKWEQFYGPVCLTLLIGLAVIGLIRLGAGF